MLLADAGAEVIKVEPIGGEETRALDPLLVAPSGESVSAYFLRLNRSKRSICIDLKSEVGKQVFLDLAEHADVVVENYRAGVMDRLKVGYEVLRARNPGLVYCSISGHGHTEGPRRDEPAFAALAEVSAGVFARSRAGDPPARLNVPLGDLYPASMAVGGICMALLRRIRTRRGAHVDIAMYDALVSLNENALSMWAMAHQSTTTAGRPTYAAPFGLFEAAEGVICIAVLGEKVWHRFCQAIERPDLAADARLDSGSKRAGQMGPDAVLGKALADWLASMPSREAVRRLMAADVPAGMVREPEDVIGDPQTAARAMMVEFASPVPGIRGRSPASPIRITGSPASVGPAPAPGANTREVLHTQLGYSADAITDLINAGVIA
jgi:crotonobetainyl-CoA:carnitine CoA-transferase CaiB-like acyl-CoA transferase